MGWPAGVDPDDYREVFSGEIVFPHGDPLEQLAGLPELPAGTIIRTGDDLRVVPESRD